MTTFAIDTETYYSDECSVQTLGPEAYARHPDWDCFLLTMAGDDGTTYCGPPEQAPWNTMMGQIWVMHNAQFDLTMLQRLAELKRIPRFTYHKLHDTADAVAYLGLPRSLAEASALVLGTEVSKETRTRLKGMRPSTFTPEFWEELKRYALQDAVLTLKLWEAVRDKWPEHERALSEETRRMCMDGVPIDIESARAAARMLSVKKWEARSRLPWESEVGDSDAGLLSLRYLNAACKDLGVPPPPSTSAKSEEFDAWLASYADKVPWIQGFVDYRRINKHLVTVETIIERTRPEDNRMAFGLKYFGATITGRDSGSSGWNPQNQPRDEVFGVNLRSLIRAPEGETLIIVDQSQIEPRCLHYLAGDSKMLQYMRETDDFYEAQALGWGLWSADRGRLADDPKTRHAIKSYNLGCGYGLSAAGFCRVSGMSIEEGERIVKMYRSKNPKILALWKKLDARLKSSVGKNLVIELPSLRKLRYLDIRSTSGGYNYVAVKQGKQCRCRIWFGTLVENVTQAMARDVFMYNILKLREHGFRVILRVHDEAVIQVRKEDAEEVARVTSKIFSTPPEWAPDLPLASKTVISDHYTK